MTKNTFKPFCKMINSFLIFLLVTVVFLSNHSFALNKNHYLYDRDGKLIEMSQSDGTIDYRYDLNGNVIDRLKDRNLLINSSFEVLKNQTTEVASNWATWKNSAELPTSSQLVQHPVDSGRYAQKVSASQLPKGNLLSLYQKVSLQPEKSIQATVRAEVESLKDARVLMTIDFHDAAGKYLSTIGTTDVAYKTNGYMTLNTSGKTPVGTAYGVMQMYIISKVDGGSGTVYWDSAALRYSEPNLLSNSSMEKVENEQSVASSWATWKNSAELPTSSQLVQHPVDSGRYAQKVSANQLPKGNLLSLYQKVLMQPEKSIQATVQAEVESLKDARVLMTIDFHDASGKYLSTIGTSDITNKTNGYMTLNASGKTPVGTAYGVMQMYIISKVDGGSGTVYWDSAALRYSEPNLLSNSSMEKVENEQSVASSWATWKNSAELPTSSQLVQHPVDSGRYAQKVSANQLPKGNLLSLYQKVLMQPEKSIQATVRAEVESLKDARVLMTIDFHDASGKYLSTIGTSDITNKTNGYMTLNTSGKTPVGTAYGVMQMYIISKVDGGAGTVYWDSAVLSYK